MKRHIFLIIKTLCLITISSCVLFNKTQKKTSDNPEENQELVIEEEEVIDFQGNNLVTPPPPPPSASTTESSDIAERIKSLIGKERIDYHVKIKAVTECNGKLYLILPDTHYNNELWEFDGDTSLTKLIDFSVFDAMEAQAKSELKFETGNEFGNSVRGINSLAVVNNKLYFTFSNGRASRRLFQYSATQGPLVIDGVTNVKRITTWENFGLVFIAIDDNDVEGLFTLDENGKPKLLLESHSLFPNFIQDGIPYGYARSLPVIDSNLFIISNRCPYVVKQNGEYNSWKFPERFNVKNWAKIENGVFIVDNLYGIFITIENDCKKLKSASTLPEFMQVYKIDDDIKSIDNTVYFNAKSKSLEPKVLYYRNENVFGDLTEKFENNDIKVKDLVTSIRGNLIIGKTLTIDGYYLTLLQSYNIENDELKDITFRGKPMEINKIWAVFHHKGYLYFVGNNTEYKNCLWRYDGINDPELIEFKNSSKEYPQESAL